MRVGPGAESSVRGVFAALLVVAVCVSSTHALPLLQLGVAEAGAAGYDLFTESVQATDPVFTLIAYLDTNSGAALPGDVGTVGAPGRPFYVSVAVERDDFTAVPETAADLGSFEVAGTVVRVTEQMTWGTAPLEEVLALQGWDPHDLAKHGVFPTWFHELEIAFDVSREAQPVNVQDSPGAGLATTSGSGFYYTAIPVDASGLAPGYHLHFDLYDEEIHLSRNGGGATDIDVGRFAPFSHDLNSGFIVTPPPPVVPEPAGFLLLVLLALPWYCRVHRPSSG